MKKFSISESVLKEKLSLIKQAITSGSSIDETEYRYYIRDIEWLFDLGYLKQDEWYSLYGALIDLYSGKKLTA